MLLLSFDFSHFYFCYLCSILYPNSPFLINLVSRNISLSI
uniref:Uncharacterized protein n=1 Tax=Anguilla anguilla TaxID=7936 RepID=A0A0E9SBH5_ANGAN